MLEHPDITNIERTGYATPEEKPYCRCSGCVKDIFTGEKYMAYDDVIFCMDCVWDYTFTAGDYEEE